MSGRSYRDLIAWKKAMDLVESVYKVSQSRPKDEQYGLTNQIRRAAVSIPANIAEGQGRTSAWDFLRFLLIANGSLHEVETHLMIAQRLTYLTQNVAEPLLQQTSETGRLLNGLMNNLRGRTEN
jgi:four helix bundle protein